MTETRFPTGISGKKNDDLDISSDSDIALYPQGNIWISQGTKLIFEGTTPDDWEVKLQATTVTADRDIILPDADGTVAVSVSDTTTTTQGQLNLDFTLSSTGNISATGSAFGIASNSSPTFAGLTIDGSSIVFEGSTADANETTLTVTNPTADNTITLPNASGTVAVSVSDTTTTTQGDLSLDFTLSSAGNISATGSAYGMSSSSSPAFAGLTMNGNISFTGNDIQSIAYAGGQGHSMMIDTNRTDTYTAVGSADKPFKTFAAAIAAAEAMVDTSFTFVLMGCTVTENVDFSGTTFTQITIATSCRSVISGNITIASIPTLSQLVIRNIEVGGTFTLTGDGTSEQMNNCSFYNASFTGAVNITATNATAFYEAAFFSTVNFTNLSYLYINGAQFNADWTITADSTGVIPSRGINPGTGGSIAIVFGTIANNVYLVKGGTATYVFQPHMTRLGRTTESYTIPSGWTVSAYGADFRGTWTNNGSMGLKISGTDNRVLGTAPSYSSIVGGDRVIADLAPVDSKGVAGDRAGMIAANGSYLYICTADYTTGVADIWSRTSISASTW
jgi:hypothetical protein